MVMRLLVLFLYPLLVAGLSIYLVGLGGSVAWSMYSMSSLWDTMAYIFVKQIGTPLDVLRHWSVATRELFFMAPLMATFFYLLLGLTLLWWIIRAGWRSALGLFTASMFCGPSMTLMLWWLFGRIGHS